MLQIALHPILIYSTAMDVIEKHDAFDDGFIVLSYFEFT